ncbi:tripartite-type tricarboxylate transporter receptor subunit TctC [Achromobacter deleyi]|uniref:Bug family tripartite tricarboxylate transporter substrate binding protein n=1 Tax=Achromobacter TaxID=222 RepID=UPI0028664B12|nr:tripartite tricarboxylate transporter substrate binding protein [Achromobacter deleyi]MDR6601866.1 tripartite-type tricarboxylate transporter receptor subunit TctC [Achromobacter deleyi]
MNAIHGKRASARQPRATRRGVLAAAMALCASLLAGGQAWAASDYPAGKPINLVVPFPAGGGTDFIGRLLAAELGKILQTTVVVENKGGANSNIGTAYVTQAKPDGYTLLLSGVGMATNQSLYSRLPYRLEQLDQIAILAYGVDVLVTSPTFPAKSYAEFVEMVRKEPGKYSYASSGNGTSGHLGMEMLKMRAKLDMMHVPYNGGSAAINDVLAGRVDTLFLNQDTVLPHVRAGKLRALAIGSAERNPVYPDTPTLAESGQPGFSSEYWFGLSAPAGLPDEVFQKLFEATGKAMQSPQIREKLGTVGLVIPTLTDKDQYATLVKREVEKWGEVVRASGARID